jgi:predicted PurR-regulated permease PerM
VPGRVERPMASTLPDKPSYFTRHVLIVVGIVVLVLLVWKIAPVLILFFAGVTFAVALRAGAHPIARRFHIGETWAVAIVSLLVVLAFVGGGYFFGHQITQQTQELVSALRDAWEKLQAWVEKTPMGASMMDQVQTASSQTGDAMTKVAKGTFTVFGAVADVALVIFLAVYLAADPRTYRNGFLLLLPPAARDDVGHALDSSAVNLRKWLLGQLVAMVVVGVVTGIGLWAIGVPLALPLAILSGILEFVPVVGPLVAAVPGVLIAFTQGPEVALYAALVYFGVQFIEGNFVMPLAQRWAVSLPPALSLIGIVGFGLLFGLAGVLFAMPLLVVAVTLVDTLYVERMSEELPEPAAPPSSIQERKRRTR